MKFSLVYTTRDRPQFIANAIKFLERQNYTDFEVIVVDNCSQESLSCERVCTESTLGNVKYIRAPRDLGMVENWNYAAEFPVGDYTCFFTDKMFILPDTLDRVGKIIEAASPDLVSWVANGLANASVPLPAGKGTINVMGLFGRSCAIAAKGAIQAISNTFRKKLNALFCVVMLSPPPAFGLLF